MTSLLTTQFNTKSNTDLNSLVTAPISTTKTQVGMPPEAKSALLSASMCAVLGGVWAAPPKFNAQDLLNMKNDTFVSTTQKAKTACPEAFSNFNTVKENIQNKTDNYINHFFGEKNKITKREILDLVEEKNETTLKTSIEKLESKLSKIGQINDDSFWDNLPKNKRLKEEQKEQLKKAFGDELYNEIITKKPSNIREYILEQCDLLEKKKVGQHFCSISIDNQLKKEHATSNIKSKLTKELSATIEDCYQKIKSKLPKTRLKTAAKWFASGLLISVILDTIFNFIRSKKSTK